MLPFELEAALGLKKQREAQIEHASLYTIFLNDERAIKLLEKWREAAKRIIPTNATLQEYVAATKAREWLQTIEDNIELAKRPADFLTT
jgi:hypothetical protein